MKKYTYIIILLFLTKLNLNALSDSLDSTYLSIKKLPNDSLKVAQLNNLSYHYLKVNTDTSIMISKSAVEISTKLGHQFSIASSYNQLGLAYKYKAQYDSALVYYSKSLNIFNILENSTDAARVLNRMGNVYKRFGEFQRAIECFQLSLKHFKKSNDLIKASWVLNNIGALYFDMGYYDKAIGYYKKNLELREKSENTSGIHTVYMNIGNAYTSKLNYTSALNYYNLSFDNLTSSTNKYDKMLLAHNIGSCYENLGRYSEAKNMYERAIKLQTELGENEMLIYSLQGVGNILIKREEYIEGIKYLKKAYQLAIDIKDIRKQHRLSKNLYLIYDDLQNYKQGMYYLKKFMAIEDSIYSLDKKKLLVEQEQKYKAKEREQQIAFLEKEKEIQDLKLIRSENEALIRSKQRNILILMIIFTFALLIIILKGSIKRKKRNLLLVNQNQKIIDQRSEIIKRNEALLESNKTKDRLFQIIAHDLRSPLISIDSLSQLVPFWVDEQDYNSLEKLAQTMQVSISNVLSLIDNLLNWALSQQGKFPFNPENFKLVRTLRNAIDIYYPIADLKNIVITLKVPNDTLIFADKNMFLTVVRNLLNNAIKFTPDGGKIEIGVDYQHSFAKIWVKDSGAGIPEKYQEKMFELASEGAQGTGGESGKGLGLFFCKEFVNINNGDVYLDTTYKNGTKIVFTLPLVNTSYN